MILEGLIHIFNNYLRLRSILVLYCHLVIYLNVKLYAILSVHFYFA